MNNLEIKALIMLSGKTISSIAREARVTREWVSKVINRQRKSPRVQKAVADAVGKSVKELWPGKDKAVKKSRA